MVFLITRLSTLHTYPTQCAPTLIQNTLTNVFSYLYWMKLQPLTFWNIYFAPGRIAVDESGRYSAWSLSSVKEGRPHVTRANSECALLVLMPRCHICARLFETFFTPPTVSRLQRSVTDTRATDTDISDREIQRRFRIEPPAPAAASQHHR